MKSTSREVSVDKESFKGGQPGEEHIKGGQCG